MSYDIEIRHVEAQPVVAIRTRCATADLQKFMQDALPATFRYVMSKGQQPVGPPFSVYYHYGPDGVDLACGCPVAAALPGDGRIEAGELPASEVAFTWHVGPYDKLGDAYGALQQWIAKNGRTIGGAPWEVYWTDPGQEPDPSKWKTEILQPLGP